MLPPVEMVMKWIGRDHIHFMKLEPEIFQVVTEKTVRNWEARKSIPRETVVRRLTEAWQSAMIKWGAAEPIVSEYFDRLWQEKDKEESLFFVQWVALLDGVELSQNPSSKLFVVEARRLLELMRRLKPLVATGDTQGVAKILRDAEIPTPELTLTALRHLDAANTLSNDLMTRGLAPIILVNTLYLIECLNVEQYPLKRLCPQRTEKGVEMPMNRWLDGIRATKGFRSDRELGEFLLPEYDPDNAKRELLKWRKGNLPAWSAISGMAGRHDAEQIYEVYAIIRVLHGIFASLELDKEVQEAIDMWDLFGCSDYLHEYASNSQCALAQI